ncbi:MAG: hypothetical protein CVU43_02470 [Chloroflexi bacterium HGW-Chloroflexi-5]|jgi:hypothetical protein|nr:MAG: hypothetical protein CVU43_02470 [Chloroflexi bacterium HGW-Chloroflexi-5]
MTQGIPPQIQNGISLASAKGIQIIGEPFCFESTSWVFEVRLALELNQFEIKTPFLEYSNWYVVVADSYPFGDISIYPSKENGIIETYPHQSINLEGQNKYPWRSGKLCLDSPINALGVIAGNQDPIGNGEERISWHLSGALGWIRAAASNTLVKNGDPFESPSYPTSKEKYKLVHDESPETFHLWKNIKPFDWGYTILENLSDIDQSLSVVSFYQRRLKKPPRVLRSTSRCDPSKHSLSNPKVIKGIWWLWSKPVVLYPWQAPSTWEELRAIGNSMAIDVDCCLNRMVNFLRENNSRSILIGYPIPKFIGDPPSEIYWKAISIKELDKKKNFGTRPGHKEKNIWQLDREILFGDKKTINYIDTENWHPDRAQARGRFLESLRNSKITLIGTGGLGSLIAELLIRGGVKNTVFVDPELLVMGNLVRHTLSGQEVGRPKAQALADRLSSVAPFSKITPINTNFPTARSSVIELLDDSDIVIDCTADDAVLLELSMGWWNINKIFISSSVGYKAKRTFVFAHRGHDFPAKDFLKNLSPFIQEEQSSWAGEGETLEGAGCWSPLFPARLDDLFLSASATIKILEELVEKKIFETSLIILEQISNSEFSGLKRSNVIVPVVERE